MKTYLAITAFIVALVTGTTGFAEGNPASSRVTIDPREQFQVIEGFGLNFTGPYFRDDQKPMFDMLINDLGATMFRVVPYLVYSNWEETNDNDDPSVMNWEYYNDRYSTPLPEFQRYSPRDRSYGPGSGLDDRRQSTTAATQSLPAQGRSKPARALEPGDVRRIRRGSGLHGRVRAHPGACRLRVLWPLQ
jgi:hypothetical protein